MELLSKVSDAPFIRCHQLEFYVVYVLWCDSREKVYFIAYTAKTQQ